MFILKVAFLFVFSVYYPLSNDFSQLVFIQVKCYVLENLFLPILFYQEWNSFRTIS